VKDREKDPPDAVILIGSAVFDVWTTSRGIKRIGLPPIESCATCRRNAPVDVNINRYMGLGESRWVEDAAVFIQDMFDGKAPVVNPPVDFGEMTAFTRCVLEAAMEIPWGETRSYKWVAQQAGKPKAARAVGQALGRNPVPLVAPCHRVIREDGSLGGFGMGIGWKEWLLMLERGGKGL